MRNDTPQTDRFYYNRQEKWQIIFEQRIIRLSNDNQDGCYLTVFVDHSQAAALGYTCPEENGFHCITPFDLFPRTQHCESVMKLIRSDMNS